MIYRQTSYDSDVFRYTQLSQQGSTGGLYAGRFKQLKKIYDEINYFVSRRIMSFNSNDVFI